MFSKLALFATASMAIFVAAAPNGGGGISNSCNTGSIQCCMLFLSLSALRILVNQPITSQGDQVFESTSSESDFLKGIFNIATGPSTGQVGASCSGTTSW